MKGGKWDWTGKKLRINYIFKVHIAHKLWIFLCVFFHLVKYTRSLSIFAILFWCKTKKKQQIKFAVWYPRKYSMQVSNQSIYIHNVAAGVAAAAITNFLWTLLAVSFCLDFCHGCVCQWFDRVFVLMCFIDQNAGLVLENKLCALYWISNMMWCKMSSH